MGSSSDRVFDLKCDEVAVGLSTIIGLTGAPYQNSIMVKYLSGGTLRIGGSANYAGTAFTWNQGYLVGTSEVVTIEGAGKVNLAATGATVVVEVIRSLTNQP